MEMKRATYGKSVLENLSQKLTNEFGKGFSVDNLEKMRKFYNVFPNSETLSRKFKLVSLFRINKIEEKKNKRNFYLKEAINSKWSVRELQRQKIHYYMKD